MKLKHKLNSLTAIATTAITVIPLCSCTTTYKLNTTAINSSNSKKDIYNIPKFIKSGTAVYQNTWVMNNSSAKREETTIPNNVFQGNKQLEHVAYSNQEGASSSDIKTISDGAFQACSNLESAWIPGTSVATNDTFSIGKRAFFRCNKLNSLDFTAYGTNHANLAAINVGDDAFVGLSENGKIYLDNTNCALFTTADGTATGEITGTKPDAEENLTTFAKKLIKAGVPKSWFTKWNIKLTVSPTKEETIGGKVYNVWNWANIASEAAKFESGEYTTTDQLAQGLEYSDTAQMLGQVNYVNVNGVAHKVRIIGYNHDTLASDSTKKAALTFEFANIISDNDGNSLATTWDGDGYTSAVNYDYLNSNVFYQLEHATSSDDSTSGKGYATLATPRATKNSYAIKGKGNWYQKGGTAPITTYGSVYSMLPSDLQSNLKIVTKSVATSSSYTKESYNAKLFLPTYREMTKSGTSSYQKDEGNAYAYYSGTYDTDAARIKKQVNNASAYTSSSKAKGAGSGTSTNIYNYAGYNGVAGETGNGGYCWLASPSTGYSNYAWYCRYDGGLDGNSVYRYARGVAPCFCI